MKTARQPTEAVKPDQDEQAVLDLARAIARAMALAHHNAESLPKPANEN
ncbi:MULTISPECIES: hypothetical protein [unclassified Thalassospira]|nr:MULTISPECIES: hypothetical protein [unclassified Thalassospira]ONH85337.1 hypothetical protein TH47_05700 [Thalassospira sp. MCCC 1A02803]